MRDKDESFADRVQNRAARTLLYGCRDIAYASYGESWRQKRKICVLKLLTLRRVRSFRVIREEETAELVRKIVQLSPSSPGDSGGVNVSELITTTMYNIICRCVVGRRFDETGEGGENRGASFREVLRKVMVQVVDLSMGDFFPLLSWVDFVTGKVKGFRNTFRALDAFVDGVIADRTAAKKNRDDGGGGSDGDDGARDFVDILLQLQESDSLGFQPTQDDLKAIITVCLYPSPIVSKFFFF